MANRKAELVAGWFLKATHDLENARLLIREQKRLLDIAAYHCQQAAEKALKGYLTNVDILFPKTHSLEELIALCISSQPGFGSFTSHAKELTPLADEFRYPGDAAEPTADEAAEALRMAEEIYAFCARQLGF